MPKSPEELSPNENIEKQPKVGDYVFLDVATEDRHKRNPFDVMFREGLLLEYDVETGKAEVKDLQFGEIYIGRMPQTKDVPDELKDVFLNEKIKLRL